MNSTSLPDNNSYLVPTLESNVGCLGVPLHPVDEDAEAPLVAAHQGELQRLLTGGPCQGYGALACLEKGIITNGSNEGAVTELLFATKNWQE